MSTREDTLCFPVSVIQKVLIAAQQKSILQDEVKVLNERITEKDRLNAATTARDSATIQSLSREIRTLNDQKGIAIGEVTALQKQLKRSRRTTRWTAIGGILLTLGVKFLIK